MRKARFVVQIFSIALLFISPVYGQSFKTQTPDTLKMLLENGIRELKQRRLNEALIHFNYLISHNYNVDTVYLYRGEALTELNRFAEAIDSYTSSISAGYPWYNVYLGRAEAKRMSSNYDGALADYDKALDLGGNIALAYFGRASCLFAKGELNRSEADYSKAIAINPKFALAYSFRGLVYQKQSRFKEAISDFDNYLRLTKGKFKIFFNRAESFYYMSVMHPNENYLDSALNDVTLYIKRYPENVDGYILKGRCCYAAKDTLCARNNFSTARKLAPETWNTNYFWGVTECFFGNYRHAAELLEGSLKYMEQPSDEYFYLGIARFENGDTLNSLASFEKSIRIKQNVQEVLEFRISHLISKTKYDTIVLKDLEQLNSQSSDPVYKAEGYFKMAMIYYRSNQFSESLNCILRAINNTPTMSQLYQMRAILGNKMKAKEDDILHDLNYAITLDPDTPGPYLLKANYFALHGDTLKGCETLNLAVTRGAKVSGAYKEYICSGKKKEASNLQEFSFEIGISEALSKRREN